MIKPHKAVFSALLPQYQWSEAFVHRFLDAIYVENMEIIRSPNEIGIKTTDQEEILKDALAYFISNKTAMEGEFYKDLSERIGVQKAKLFCEIVACDWYCKRHSSLSVAQLKNCVRQYLNNYNVGAGISSQDASRVPFGDDPLPFSDDDIYQILHVNYWMIVRHADAWKETHPNYVNLSSDNIFLRRGIGIDNLIDTSQPYMEWDYINSYSLAFSSPEKFAQNKKRKIPVLINGDLHLFDKRVLFFSPFVPGMDVGQLEAGIIPGRPERITYQGEHGGIHEYILGNGPWDDE